ncbi:MAG: antitoxin family protein, partial [Methanomicrobia archaeon]|nr:antitoxin family protein [Methanomicrobia archaeon]
MYAEGILKPLEKQDLKEGEEVEIELKKSIHVCSDKELIISTIGAFV